MLSVFKLMYWHLHLNIVSKILCYKICVKGTVKDFRGDLWLVILLWIIECYSVSLSLKQEWKTPAVLTDTTSIQSFEHFWNWRKFLSWLDQYLSKSKQSAYHSQDIQHKSSWERVPWTVNMCSSNDAPKFSSAHQFFPEWGGSPGQPGYASLPTMHSIFTHLTPPTLCAARWPTWVTAFHKENPRFLKCITVLARKAKLCELSKVSNKYFRPM